MALTLAAATFLAVPVRGGPGLIVLVSVDQMRGDYVERYRGDWAGGLRRLLDGGAWFRQATYSYSHTVTCAGHATISTGTLPRTHGMVLNEWWDRGSGESVRCTADPSVRNLPYGAEPPPEGLPGDGPGRLLSPTLADVLRLEAGARVASLSLKARSAIALAGREADLAVWLDGEGRWTTSSAFADSPPGFLAETAAALAPQTAVGWAWQPRRAIETYRGADDVAWERPPRGWGVTFPHVIGEGAESVASPTAWAVADHWRRSPLSDAALVELALAAADGLQLGRRGTTDYLAIGFSALDYVGHKFGPDSAEVEDLLLRLDESLGMLLAGLEASLGPDGFVLALTADHGVSPIPEGVRAAGLDAGRVSTEDLAAGVEELLVTRLGPGRYVAAMTHTDLYFAPGVYERIDAAGLLPAVADRLAKGPGVERVFRKEQLAGPAGDDASLRAHARSYHPDRSGDLVVSWKPYWISSSDGATHGTERAYDTRVPILLYGPGIRTGRYLTEAHPVDVAPTLAFLSGVILPSPEGRVLSEALAD
jgi:predicted AlkP superfamily pyrophosphatase or phosphodiesterase